MREHKYRVWDVFTEKMVFTGFNVIGEVTCFKGIEQYGDEHPNPKYDESSLLRLNDFILMQYTGMDDMTGTDIYEGDITEIVSENGEKNRFVVKHGIVRRVMATGYTVDIPSFYFELIDQSIQAFPIVNNYAGKHDLEMMKIIGSIYENSEWLEGGD